MNPEFLTARNNRLDFICASRIIIGSDQYSVGDRVKELYKYRFGNFMTYYSQAILAQSIIAAF